MNIDTIKRIIAGRRQYRLNDTSDGISKIWNNGHGRIDFVRVTENGYLIVNAAFWRKSDAKVAVDILNASHTPLIVRCVSYGYPEYYSHTFGETCSPADGRETGRILSDMETYAKSIARSNRGRAA